MRATRHCVFLLAVTATTVGYSDAILTNATSRGVDCVFILMCTFLFTATVARFASLRTERDIELRRWEVASQATNANLLTKELLQKLTKSATYGKHDKLSFLTEMLVHTDLVQRVEIDLLLEYFALLDNDKSGTIDVSELEEERSRVVVTSQRASSGGTPSKSIIGV